MIEATLLSQVKTLSAADRIELLGVVWASLAPEDAPVTAEEKHLLDARLADLAQNPQDQSSWRDVQLRLKQRLA
jgi:putative addiction module component (TIGR02574 family)